MTGIVSTVRVMNRVVLPDLETLNPEALKSLVIEKHALIVEQHAALSSRDAEIDNLKLRQMQFERRSKKLGRQIEQLELQLEDLETASSSPRPELPIDPQSMVSNRPRRGPLAAELLRETEVLSSPPKIAAPIAALCWNCWARMSPRRWNTFRRDSK